MTIKTYKHYVPTTPAQFLKMYTPNTENQLCECAGDMVCLPCVATKMVRELLVQLEEEYTF